MLNLLQVSMKKFYFWIIPGLIAIWLTFLTALIPTSTHAACTTAPDTGCPTSTWGCYNSITLIRCCDSFNEAEACNQYTPITPIEDETDIFCNSTPGNIRTALGCINASEPRTLINQIVTWSVGIAALASFVAIAYAGFLMVTASGDVKRVNDAKSFLMSALIGLALVALAVLIFNFVGVRIFGADTFGFLV